MSINGNGEKLRDEKIRRIVRTCAAQAGLPVCGVTTAEPFDDTLAILRGRKAKGILPGFMRENLEQLCDPKAALKEAVSIVSFALPYYGGPVLEAKDVSFYPFGRIARFACGPDYHVKLKACMELFVNNLKRSLGMDIQYRVFVDTGALIDRAAAVRAGIGWYGKNACVITPQYGSWVVLGEVVMDLPLPPDRALEKNCGACLRCIESCPTGALAEPYVVNPRKCLSYITQAKGIVPLEYRKLLGVRLYGCDSCQEVCPYNQGQLHKDRCVGGKRPVGEHVGEYGDVAGREFKPSEDSDQDLLKLVAMTEQEFNNTYGNKAFGWRGHTVLQRNAIVALGNSESPHVCETLKCLLENPISVIRAHAVWALSQYRPSWFSDTVQRMLETEKDSDVLKELHGAAG